MSTTVSDAGDHLRDASSDAFDPTEASADTFKPTDTSVDEPDSSDALDSSEPEPLEDVAPEVPPEDVCAPVSDSELCALHTLACGLFEGTDPCGQHRSVTCGSCGANAHCEQGVCIDYVYAWRTGGWSACSPTCGDGTHTRDVWCERDDGFTVADTKCPSGSKPSTSGACTNGPCCTPSCVSHDACGSDGCGGSCGACGSGRSCHNGYCVWTHGNNGSASCAEICFWGHSDCIDTSSGGCGDNIVTTCYCW